MTIGIIDLGISNIKSVQNMIRKAGGDAIISAQTAELAQCQKLILPGVGAFDPGVRKIHEKGLWNFIRDYSQQSQTQLLGICLGMQLLTKGSEEGELPGLGLIDAVTLKFQPQAHLQDLKIPNMGWRETFAKKPHELAAGLSQGRFYYVHSYYVKCESSEDILFTSEHGISFTSGFSKNNIYGVQFHPEKSHRFGLQLMSNFCRQEKRP